MDFKRWPAPLNRIEIWIGLGAIVLTFMFFFSFLLILGPQRNPQVTRASSPVRSRLPASSPTAPFVQQGQTVELKAIGALGDGVHDDTEAIQAAIFATPPGGTLKIAPGRYLVSAPLRVRQPMTLEGAGKGVSIFVRLQAANSEILVVDLTNLGTSPQQERIFRAKGFSLTTEGEAEAQGVGFLVKAGTQGVEIENLELSQLKTGLDIRGGTKVSVKDLEVTRPGSFGLRWAAQPPTKTNVTFEQIKIEGGPSSKMATGCMIEGGDTVDLEQLEIHGLKLGLVVRADSATGAIDHLKIADLKSTEQSSHGFVLEGDSGAIHEAVLEESQLDSNGGHGIYAFGMLTSSLKITKSHFGANGLHGMFVEGPQKLELDDDNVWQNSRLNPNTHHGISIGKGSKEILISHLKVGNLSGEKFGQLYGIYIFGRGVESVHLADNVFEGNGHPCPYLKGCGIYRGDVVVKPTEKVAEITVPIEGTDTSAPKTELKPGPADASTSKVDSLQRPGLTPLNY